ncbi:MAG: hypothetical protein QXX92_07280 [Candidatus Bathyarchaeia archaeon]
MKKKTALTILVSLLVTLSCGCFSASATPNSVAEQMVLKFLGNIVGMDMSRCSILSSNASTARMPNSPHYQTNIKIVIDSSGAQFEAAVTLVDGKIWTYHLYGEFKEGNLTLRDCLNVANKSLTSYQTFIGKSYGELLNMLTEAISEEKTEVKAGDFTLNVSYIPTNYREAAIVRYVRMINGYSFPGDYFVISVSKDGLLTTIIDNTIFYVATTDVKISESEAINKALPYAEKYANQHGQKITTVNATFEFARDVGSVRGDNFAIYPQWRVWFTFDKTNEENVYAYAVLIWADSGEIYNSGPQGFYNASLNGDANASSLWQIVAVLAIFTLFPALTISVRYKVKARRKNR